MSIPFYGAAREYAAHRETYQQLFDQVLTHGKVLQGPEVTALESTVCALTGRKHAVAVNSCTDALYIALRACGIQPGDEVLVTGFSFIASVSCVLRLGAVPVFCDVERFTGHIDLEKAAAMISDKTRALVFPHLFGNMAEPEALESFASEHGIVLIEDAAQSIGAKFHERMAGSIGMASCISFDPTKVIGAPGSGGMVTCDDDETAEVARKLRYHGKSGAGSFDLVGLNSQMPSLTAALLDFKLTQRATWEDRRRAIAHRYAAELDVDPLRHPQPDEPVFHIYHKYVMIVVSTALRDGLMKHLKEAGTHCMVHYGTPIQDQPLVQAATFRSDDAAITRNLAAHVLSLPIHPWLQNDEVGTVIGQVQGFFDESS